MNARLAFSKPTPDPADELRLRTAFRPAGYEGLQLKMGQFLPWLDDPAGFRESWPEEGSASAVIFFDTLEADGAERLRRTIEFAGEVGSERVVFCHNHDRQGVTPERLGQYARELSEFGRRAADRGVALSLHHHFGQPVMTAEDAQIFFDAVEGSLVGLTVDTAHLAKSGIEDLPGFIRRFAGVIDNIHLKDYADGEWRLLGEGELDLVGILAALDDIGFAEWLCVDEETDSPLDTGLTVSRDWLAAHL